MIEVSFVQGNNRVMKISAIFVLVFVLAYVSAEDNKAEVKENPALSGHQIRFNENSEGRKVGLKKVKELMKRNLNLKPKQEKEQGDENRDKRGILSHQFGGHGGYQQPDYVIEYQEYCYDPQPYYCY